MSYERATIMSELSRIQNRELILPDIQRDFVWPAPRIYRLLDSVLRGYPFGTLLFWNTRDEVQYRPFTKDWTPGTRPTYQIKPAGTRGTVVLDGQQRLQSLYLAVYGTHEGKTLHLDLLSGARKADVAQLRYGLEFLPPGEAGRRNRERPGEACWVSLRDIACLPSQQRVSAERGNYLAQLNLGANSEAGGRLTANLENVYHAFRSDELLTYYTIDRDYGTAGRTGIHEILEIFARVNSGGQLRTSSDMMFSLLKLHWHGAATEIGDLVERLNAEGDFGFDKDFVLKCALVCADQGARYEAKKFRGPETLGQISAGFDRLGRALSATVEFLVGTARLRHGRVRALRNTLVPFAYFLYLQPDQSVPDRPAQAAMNQALYLALMAGAFAHYADNRIDHAVRQVLQPAHREQPGVFPLPAFQAYLAEIEGHAQVDDELLGANPALLANILGCGTPGQAGRTEPGHEGDRVFPRAELRKRGYAEEQINHFANLRLVSEHNAAWKSNQDPRRYFAAHPEDATRYLIPAQYLSYDQFPQFLEERRQLIWGRVREFLWLDGEGG